MATPTERETDPACPGCGSRNLTTINGRNEPGNPREYRCQGCQTRFPRDQADRVPRRPHNGVRSDTLAGKLASMDPDEVPPTP